MHLSIYAYTNHIAQIGLSSILALLPGSSFSVDIDKSAIRYYSGIFPFYFILFLLIQVLVIWSLCFACDCG